MNKNKNQSKNNDLWAEIPTNIELSSPKELMKEQAAYLKERTNGLLTIFKRIT